MVGFGHFGSFCKNHKVSAKWGQLQMHRRALTLLGDIGEHCQYVGKLHIPDDELSDDGNAYFSKELSH